MLAIVCESSSAEHMRHSAGISSGPLARPVLSLPIASVTSSDVIGRVNCDGSNSIPYRREPDRRGLLGRVQYY